MSQGDTMATLVASPEATQSQRGWQTPLGTFPCRLDSARPPPTRDCGVASSRRQNEGICSQAGPDRAEKWPHPMTVTLSHSTAPWPCPSGGVTRRDVQGPHGTLHCSKGTDHGSTPPPSQHGRISQNLGPHGSCDERQQPAGAAARRPMAAGRHRHALAHTTIRQKQHTRSCDRTT